MKGFVGCVLVVLGGVIVLAGVVMVGTVALTAWATYQSSTPAPTFTVSDWTKLAEALARLPHWAIAIILGNVQILMGFWVWGGKITLFGQTLELK
jgi:hypothetical protein